MADESRLPLAGVILCCTSIPPDQRSSIIRIAEEMGAVNKHDLTSDVTHLVVGEMDTPKFKFVARERSDVRVMLPTWVEAVRALWLEGGEIDVAAIEEEHKLPTFCGLKVCVTGFDDLAFRQKIEEEVVANRGEYRPNLTKDVTHLIAKEPTGQKFNFAKQWKIKTVAIEWLEQSLERGMVLEENLYHPLIPLADRGKNAWIRRTTSAVSIGKRGREAENGSQRSRKLRRTASAKFEADNSGLWTDMLSNEAKPQERREDQWDEKPIQGADVDDATKPKQGGKTGATDRRRDVIQRADSRASFDPSLQSRGLFDGKVFKVHGFDESKMAIAKKHLESHCAEVADDTSNSTSEVDLVLVPHTMPSSDALALEETFQGATLVTDLWIERCLHLKRLESPSESVTSTPIRVFPISGFEELKISGSGFQGIDLLHVSKVVKLLGGSYVEDFTSQSSALICGNAASVEKLQHALLWELPAVKVEWLWDCVRRGELVPFDDYLTQPVSLPTNINSNLPDSRSTSRVPAKMSHEGATDLRQKTSVDLDRRRETSGKPASVTGKKLKRKRSPSESARQTRPNQFSFPDDSGPSAVDDTFSISSHANLPPPKNDRQPLQETSPNSSPPKVVNSAPVLAVPSRPSPPNRPLDSEKQPSNENDLQATGSLGEAITSLLEHHQKTRASRSLHGSPVKTRRPASSGLAITTNFSSTMQAPNSPSRHPQRRRRRQIFGRAVSNLSSTHSLGGGAGGYEGGVGAGGGSRNVTRASSIDTTHTDGLGTPILAAQDTGPTDDNDTNNNINNESVKDKESNINEHNTKPKLPSQQQQKRTNPDLPTSKHALFHHDEHSNDDDPDKPSDEHLQMTQLGYADPDVMAWRERVARKLDDAGSGGGGGGGGGVHLNDREKDKKKNDINSATAEGDISDIGNREAGRIKEGMTPGRGKKAEALDIPGTSVASRTRGATAGR